MNGSTEIKAPEKCKNILREMCAYKLKSDYDMKLSLKKDGENEAICSHSASGSSEHNIVKIMTAVAVITLSACAISSACSILSRFTKR